MSVTEANRARNIYNEACINDYGYMYCISISKISEQPYVANMDETGHTEETEYTHPGARHTKLGRLIEPNTYIC